MTPIPEHFPRVAAEAATRVCAAREAGGEKAAYRAALTLSAEQVEALALVAANLLEPAFPARRWSGKRARGLCDEP